MSEAPAEVLRRLARLWRRRRRAQAAMVAGGLWLPASAAAGVLAGRRLVPAVLAALLLAVLALLAGRRWLALRPGGVHEIAAHLDSWYPAFEHSAALLVAETSALAPVARLQRARTARALTAHRAPATLVPRQSLPAAGGWLMAGLAAGAVIWWWLPASRAPAVAQPAAPAEAFVPAVPAAAAVRASIEALTLRIEPPAYTGRPVRTVRSVDAPRVEVAEGAHITWQLAARGADPETAAELVIDERTVGFSRLATGRFRHREIIHRDHVFAARLRDGAGQELESTAYTQLRMLRDQPPTVRVRAPALVVEIAPETPDAPEKSRSAGSRGLALTVVAEVRDDYGLARTSLVATLALGAGEMVQFREQRFALERRETRADATQVLVRRLDLAALGLVPGGELYFLVEAWDNRPGAAQRTRSSTHVVRWPGAGTETVDLGAGLPMLLGPETFRSQRQIVIDTERLLAERSRLSGETVASRARSIAFDQHALRLRYGAILGDEFEDGQVVGIGEDGAERGDSNAEASRAAGTVRHDREPGSPGEDHPGDHGESAEHGGLRFGTGTGAAAVPTRLIDLAGELEGDWVHAHDSKESATFFTTETKRVLKSSLANMWEAELKLHLGDAEAALPYEYRALRLLKQVQQASRVYVRRVGFDSPPLDWSRRLSAALDDIPIRRPHHRSTAQSDHPAARRALAALAGHAASEPAVLASLLEAAAREVASVLAGARVDVEALSRLRSAAAKCAAGRALEPRTRSALVAVLWQQLALPTPTPNRSAASRSARFERYQRALAAELAALASAQDPAPDGRRR